jgi:iron complex outermembrane receptor protein
MWGANAVNGVVNIITRSAKETQGTLVVGGAGVEERGFGGVRHGGKLGTHTFYRAYVKYADRETSLLPSDHQSVEDGWDLAQTGFRLEHEWAEADTLTVQGDFYSCRAEQAYLAAAPPVPPFSPPRLVEMPTIDRQTGGNLLARWVCRFSDSSDLQVRAYFDGTSHSAIADYQGRRADEEVRTFDLDAQHHFELLERHDIIYGLGYRRTRDAFESNYTVGISPASLTTELFSAFFQDQYQLVQDRLFVIAGVKLEHNSFTGVEWEPSARLLWRPTDQQSVWAAISRAIRTPSRIENNGRLNVLNTLPAGTLGPGSPPMPAIISVQSNEQLRSEEAIDYEVGYRIQPWPTVSVDLALFYCDYDHLRSAEMLGLASPPPFTVANFQVDNGLEGTTIGQEVSLLWYPVPSVHLQATYTHLAMNLETKSWSTDWATASQEDASPRHQAALRGTWEVSPKVQLGGGLRFVDQLTSPGQRIPGYAALDARVAWRPRSNLEFSLVGLNLLDNRHPEFRSSTITTQQTEVERSFYAKVQWSF